MNDLDMDNHNKLKTCIGEVVISFQFIEIELAEMLSKLLRMNDKDDKHRINASMSFKQKADFVCDLYAKHKDSKWPVVNIKLLRNSLHASEEFRNTIVHSFWYISGSSKPIWMRSKSTMRTKDGLKIDDGVANIKGIEKCIKALYVIRCWYVSKEKDLEDATRILRKHSNKLSRKINIA